MEKVQSYEEAFAKIQAATGISDIDELVTTFINAEDQNFALFNYVNELNGECEKLEEQIADIRSEIEKYKGQGLNTDNQRKKILKDLEDRLARTEAKAEQYEKKYEAAMKTVNALKTGIQSIFKKIGCDTPANMEMLGNEGVTESNMMQYLGIIEQRTNEILQLYAATQAREGVVDASGNPVPAVSSILGQGPQLPAGRNNITIQPPSATDEAYDSEEDSDDEDEDRPYSRDELKAKTLRGLHKRENKEKKKEGKRAGAAGGAGGAPARGKGGR
jgi:TolA-binding protein